MKLSSVLCCALAALVFFVAAARADIVIGANLELTGPIATLGQGAKEGILLAAAQRNAKGGLLGQQIRVVVLDNRSEAAESANQTTKLITEKRAIALLGPVTSGNTKAAAPIARDKGIVLLTPTATNPEVTTIGPTIFRACFLDSYQGEAIARFARNVLKAKKMVVLVENGNDYARGLGGYAAKTFAQLGGTVMPTEYYAKGEKDYSAMLTKIKPGKPDFIVLPSYYDTVALCVKQARAMGITAPIMGGDGWDSPKLVQLAGARALNNTYFTNHYSPNDTSPVVQNFVKAYQAKYHRTPDALAALGYDAALMLFDAIARAKSTNSPAIRSALAGTKNFQGVSGSITMGKDRNPIKSITILAMIDGKQTFKKKMSPNK